ncbi:hypothetical protein B0A56_14015, partial [Flavobacterium columnare NBRC 100251 = ATCC 23463]
MYFRFLLTNIIFLNDILPLLFKGTNKTEYLWLQAECQGSIKKHEGEFLKKDGAYFEIGKKCECE